MQKGLTEFGEISRLQHNGVGPKPIGGGDVVRARVPGENDDGNQLGSRIGSKIPQNPETAHIWELHVQNHQVRALTEALHFGERIKSPLSRDGNDDLIRDVVFLQRTSNKTLIIEVIFD